MSKLIQLTAFFGLLFIGALSSNYDGLVRPLVQIVDGTDKNGSHVFDRYLSLVQLSQQLTLVGISSTGALLLRALDTLTLHQLVDIIVQVPRLECGDDYFYDPRHFIATPDGHFAYICGTTQNKDKFGLTIYAFNADGKFSNFTFAEPTGAHVHRVFYQGGRFHVVYMTFPNDLKLQRLWIQGFDASIPQENGYGPTLLSEYSENPPLLDVYCDVLKSERVACAWTQTFTTVVVEVDLQTGKVESKNESPAKPDEDIGGIVRLIALEDDYVLLFPLLETNNSLGDGVAEYMAKFTNRPEKVGLGFFPNLANSLQLIQAWSQGDHFAVLVQEDSDVYLKSFDNQGKAQGDAKHMYTIEKDTHVDVAVVDQTPYLLVLDENTGNLSIGQLPRIDELKVELAFLQLY